MNKKPMTVHEVAGLTGVTARTLHYYDEIGLLKPSIVTDTKYRLYTGEDLCRLQEILFFREVGFALKDIKTLLQSPNYERTEALEKHIDILKAQQERIDAIIRLIKAAIDGEQELSFQAFSNARVLGLQAKYREEVLERWGNTDSFKEYEAAFSTKNPEFQNGQMKEFYTAAQEIFEKLAGYEDKTPDCPAVQQIVKQWQRYISEHFYRCDRQMLSYLGNLYITDARFAEFINRFGSGNLASFFSRAIEIYCKQERAEKEGADI